ncbi:MAG: DUF4296 domain-containing protein [Bacteroidales bacterium]|nr:DUF4296 domain-containing protein [Bacteroidales bacterium]
MKKLIIIISLLFFISCSKTPYDNKDVLEEKVFIEILTDIQKSQALVNSKADTSQDIRNLRLKTYNEEVLKKHKIKKEQYNKSVEYYTSDPNKFSKILEEVVKNLNKDVS